MKRTFISAVLLLSLLAGLSAMSLTLSTGASASHFTNWIRVRAPFNGYWDRYGLANPATHGPNYGGDWSTDYYSGYAGAWGYLNMTSSAYPTSSLDAQVADVGSACAGSNWAGYKLRMDLYDASGYRGWYLVSHASDTNGEYTYQPDLYSWMIPGSFIGWTSEWSYSSCWQVTTAGGIHWHIEMQQPIHYSRYVPYASGT